MFFYEVHLLPNMLINLYGEYEVWCNSWVHSPVNDLPNDAVRAIKKLTQMHCLVSVS